MVFLDKEVKFKKIPINILVLVFLFIAVLSAIFSVDKISSLFGFYGRFSNGLIPLLSFVIFYFLLINNISSESREREPNLVSQNGIKNLFLTSVFFIVLTCYFSIFGLWSKLSSFMAQSFHFSLPSFMLLPTFNPVSGSLEGLAVFLAVVVVLLTGLLITTEVNQKSKLSLFFYFLLLLSGLSLLAIIGFKAAWIILSVVLFLFLIIVLWKRIFTGDINKLILPIILLIISVFFIFTNFRNNRYFSFLPQEQILSQGVSWQTNFQGAIENVKSGFLGSGIGTYHYDFSKFRSLQFNQTSLWQIRYDRPASHISEILGTMGFLGLLSYLSIIVVFLFIAYLLLSKSDLKKQLPLLMTFSALIISQFIYYQNITLAFSFWLFLALFMSSIQGHKLEEKTFSFKETPEISLVFNIFLIIIGLAIIVCFWFAKNFYYADVLFTRFTNLQQIEKSVSLNPYSVQYRVMLAKIYLQEGLNEFLKPASQQDSKKILDSASQAINNAMMATEISPNSVVAYESLGMVYRDVRTLAVGALEWGIKSFERAAQLEPTNPVLLTELGKLYVVKNDNQKGKEAFEKAIELMPSYIDALTQDIAIYEKEQKTGDVIVKLEELALKYSSNVEIIFQLGRAYYNNGQVSEAISQFNKIIEVSPGHSNALYSLGIAYQRQGQIEDAIIAFKKVLELNPGNQDVISKLRELGQ